MDTTTKMIGIVIFIMLICIIYAISFDHAICSNWKKQIENYNNGQVIMLDGDIFIGDDNEMYVYIRDTNTYHDVKEEAIK